jgi:hypothetical protein
MSDWRTLEAGRELDRVVAERLGWKIEQDEVVYHTDTRSHDCATFPGDKVYKGRHNAWIVYDPTGKRQGWCYAHDDKPWFIEALLDHADVPAYSADANAALALLTSTGCPWMVVSEPEGLSGYRAFIGESRDDPEHMYYHGTNEGGDTVALAIVRAWLAWSERGA